MRAFRTVVRDCIAAREGEELPVGASAAIGGTVHVSVDLDCVVMRPDVTIEGRRSIATASCSCDSIG